MGEVTRYDCTSGVEGTPEMDPFSHGDWVSFEDYEKLEAKNAKLREANRWIPVTERLPEPYTEVYIWPRPDFGVTHHTGYLSRRKGDKEFRWFNNTYETNYGVEENTVRVTHWMPLPDPPQEG